MQIKKLVCYFFIINIFAIHPISEKQYKQCIIVVDPAGDAKKTGRPIGDNFERGLTLQCAEKIKEVIEKQLPYVTIIITRLPGDVIYELQNASLANRIHAHLFVTINFYQTEETKPTFYLYHFSNGNDFVQQSPFLSFDNYDQAYIINKKETAFLIHLCKEKLTAQYHHLFIVAGPYGLPIKALIGTIAPSIALEIGLKNKDSLQHYIDPLITTLITAIEYLEENT